MPLSCRRCHGSGHLWENRTFNGNRWDPQEDQDRPCPRCMGEGVEPSDERLDHLHALEQEFQRDDERKAA